MKQPEGKFKYLLEKQNINFLKKQNTNFLEKQKQFHGEFIKSSLCRMANKIGKFSYQKVNE